MLRRLFATRSIYESERGTFGLGRGISRRKVQPVTEEGSKPIVGPKIMRDVKYVDLGLGPSADHLNRAVLSI